MSIYWRRALLRTTIAVAGVLVIVLVAVALTGVALRAQSAARLTLPPTAAVVAGTVELPVTLDSAGHPISGVLFSIDYDQSCLAFQGGDTDGDGLPDGFRSLAPPQFSVSASFDASDSNGEIDVIILDFSLPFAQLPDGPLAILRFTATCVPDYAGIVRVPVEFSSSPPASFSNPFGRNVDGVVTGSIVEIVDSAAPPTPTPTVTVTPTTSPTPIATATSTALPPGAPTSTPAQSAPTATPTPFGGQVKPPIPPTPTPTATPTATSTASPTATATAAPPEETPFGQSGESLYLPAVQKQ